MATVSDMVAELKATDTQITDFKRKLGEYGVGLSGSTLSTVLSGYLNKAVSAQQIPELQALVRAPWSTHISPQHVLQPSPATQQDGVILPAYNAIIAAFSGVPGFLGPLMQLFGLEMDDTNRCLVASLPDSARAVMVAQDGHAAAQMGQIMLGHMHIAELLAIQIVDLSAYPQDHFWRFTDTTTPQMPLLFHQLESKYETSGFLNKGNGFVGMAVNLLLMPEPQYPVWIPTLQTAVSLRQTVGYLALGKSMVFETDSYLLSFTERCSAAGVLIQEPLLSLQGLTYNLTGLGISQRVPQNPTPLLFPGVPDHVRSASPMDCRCVARRVRFLCAVFFGLDSFCRTLFGLKKGSTVCRCLFLKKIQRV